MKIEHLTMIGHGTTGTDGIDTGIHLRWSFNDKLGFPACFKLFRRESDTINQYSFPIKNLPSGSIDVPNTFAVHEEPPFIFTVSSAVTNNQPQHDIDIITQPVKAIQISGDLTILFSSPVSRVELSFYINASTNFDITLLSNDTTYYPYSIKGTNPAGVENIAFDAPNATGIVFSGENIKLSALAVWACKAGDGWKRINDYCGCGLPVNSKGTPYTDDA